MVSDADWRQRLQRITRPAELNLDPFYRQAASYRSYSDAVNEAAPSASHWRRSPTHSAPQPSSPRTAVQVAFTNPGVDTASHQQVLDLGRQTRACLAEVQELRVAMDAERDGRSAFMQQATKQLCQRFEVDLSVLDSKVKGDIQKVQEEVNERLGEYQKSMRDDRRRHEDAGRGMRHYERSQRELAEGLREEMAELSSRVEQSDRKMCECRADAADKVNRIKAEVELKLDATVASMEDKSRQRDQQLKEARAIVSTEVASLGGRVHTLVDEIWQKEMGGLTRSVREILHGFKASLDKQTAITEEMDDRMRTMQHEFRSETQKLWADLKDRSGQLEVRVGRLEDAVDRTEYRVEEQRAKIDPLAAKVDILSDAVASRGIVLEQLRERAIRAEERTQKVAERVENLETECREIPELVRARTHVEKIKIEHQRFYGKIDTIKETAERDERQVTEMRSIVEAIQERMNTVGNDVKRFTTQFTDTKSRVGEFSNELSILGQQEEQLHQVTEKHENMLRTAEQRIRLLAERVEGAREKSQELAGAVGREMEDVQRRLEIVGESAVRAEQANATSAKDIARQSERLSSFDHNVKNAQENMLVLREKLERMEHEAKSALRHQQEHSKTLEMRDADLQERTNEINTRQKSILRGYEEKLRMHEERFEQYSHDRLNRDSRLDNLSREVDRRLTRAADEQKALGAEIRELRQQAANAATPAPSAMHSLGGPGVAELQRRIESLWTGVTDRDERQRIMMTDMDTMKTRVQRMEPIVETHTRDIIEAERKIQDVLQRLSVPHHDPAIGPRAPGRFSPSSRAAEKDSVSGQEARGDLRSDPPYPSAASASGAAPARAPAPAPAPAAPPSPPAASPATPAPVPTTLPEELRKKTEKPEGESRRKQKSPRTAAPAQAMDDYWNDDRIARHANTFERGHAPWERHPAPVPAPAPSPTPESGPAPVPSPGAPSSTPAAPVPDPVPHPASASRSSKAASSTLGSSSAPAVDGGVSQRSSAPVVDGGVSQRSGISLTRCLSADEPVEEFPVEESEDSGDASDAEDSKVLESGNAIAPAPVVPAATPAAVSGEVHAFDDDSEDSPAKAVVPQGVQQRAEDGKVAARTGQEQSSWDEHSEDSAVKAKPAPDRHVDAGEPAAAQSTEESDPPAMRRGSWAVRATQMSSDDSPAVAGVVVPKEQGLSQGPERSDSKRSTHSSHRMHAEQRVNAAVTTSDEEEQGNPGASVRSRKRGSGSQTGRSARSSERLSGSGKAGAAHAVSPVAPSSVKSATKDTSVISSGKNDSMSKDDDSKRADWLEEMGLDD